MNKNELEKALMGGDDGIEGYLSNVSAKDFRVHIAEIRAKQQLPDITELKEKIIEFIKTL